MNASRRLAARGTHHRHRRAPQRGQVDPLQRADQERRARGELPVRDHRAERRRRRRPGRAAARKLAELFGSAKVLPADRASSSTSPASSAARRRARAWATSSSPTSASPPRSARSPGSSATTTSPTSTARSTPADDISTIQTELILADLQTVEKAIPRLEKEARRQEGARRRPRGRPGGAGRLEAGTPIIATDDRPRAAPRAVAADRQAVHLRLQLRRRRARRRGRSSSRCGTWSRRPRRSSSTRSSRPSWSSSTTTTRPARCSPRWASTSPASTCWPGSASTPSACRPTSPPAPRRPAPGRSRKGATAPEAAGVIHTDFQRGFIKAEIVSYDDLMAAGSMTDGQGGRQGPHGGQGLRHARRRRRGVPLQRLRASIPK